MLYLYTQVIKTLPYQLIPAKNTQHNPSMQPQGNYSLNTVPVFVPHGWNEVTSGRVCRGQVTVPLVGIPQIFADAFLKSSPSILRPRCPLFARLNGHPQSCHLVLASPLLFLLPSKINLNLRPHPNPRNVGMIQVGQPFYHIYSEYFENIF